MNVRSVSRAVAGGLLVAAGVAFGPAPALAASCSGTTAQDFDDDGHADLVVARTRPQTREGVVDLVMSGGATQTVSAAGLGFTSAAGDQFGAAVQIATLDATDNCPDLVIGAPGSGAGGAVYLVRGTGSGVATDATRLVSPVAGARFGTTVGAVDLSLTRARVLVGAPGVDVGAATDAGGVYVRQLAADGTPSGSAALLTYADFGAAPAANDHLGAVMDTGSWHVTLGVPDRDVGSAADAGEVVTTSFVDEPGPILVADWARAGQNSPGAPGVAEAGDRFGASVDADAVVLVGVPGEDVGTTKDAGLAMRYADLGGHAVGGWSSWTQNSAGIPGSSEAGDRFGAAVHLGWVEVTVDDDPVARQVHVVGAPGEDLGTVANAGSVTVITPGVVAAFALSQGSGLPGKAERNDQVGAAFGDLPGEYTGPFHGGDGLLVGAPGEDVGTVVDSGLVMSARGLLPKGTYAWTSSTNLGPTLAGAQYGWTLPSAS